MPTLLKVVPVIWVLPAAVLVLAGVLWTAYQAPSPRWSYSELLVHADRGDVKEAVIAGGTATVTTSGGSTVLVDLAPGDHETLATRLQGDGVDVRYEAPGPPSWTPLAAFLGFALLPFAAWGLALWAWPVNVDRRARSGRSRSPWQVSPPGNGTS